MGAFLAILGLPDSLLMRRVLAGVAIALAVGLAWLAISHHYISIGRQQGEGKANQQEAETVGARGETNRDAAVQKIGELQAQISDLAKSAASDRQLFLGIEVQRRQSAAQLSGMTPDQVKAIINEALGRPKDSAAPYSEGQQQQIAGCFQQLNLCNQQVTRLGSENGAQAAALAKHEQKYSALVEYTVGIEGDNVELRRLIAAPRRSIRCLYLCKKKPKIKAPDPALLRRPEDLPTARAK